MISSTMIRTQTDTHDFRPCHQKWLICRQQLTVSVLSASFPVWSERNEKRDVHNSTNNNCSGSGRSSSRGNSTEAARRLVNWTGRTVGNIQGRRRFQSRLIANWLLYNASIHRVIRPLIAALILHKHQVAIINIDSLQCTSPMDPTDEEATAAGTIISADKQKENDFKMRLRKELVSRDGHG